MYAVHIYVQKDLIFRNAYSSLHGEKNNREQSKEADRSKDAEYQNNEPC